MGPVVTLDRVTKFYRRWGAYRWQSFKGALLKGELIKSFTSSSHVRALEDVTFSVEPGEMVGVIGRNGSGKSTLLKVIAGLLQPGAGSVAVKGRVAALLELGAGFHPEISGLDNVMINGVMMGLKRREVRNRLDQIVRFAELEDFIHEPVKTYSSGMYIRLGFSVAVHVDADILLVDEVLAVGDEAFSRKCIQRIQELQREGVAVIFVSHDLALVRRLCRRALWLREGKAVEIGDPPTVIDAYLTEVGRAEPEERQKNRYGDGRARITSVRVIDSSGDPISTVPGGAYAAIELAVETEELLTDFAFGIALRHLDGTLVYGTNTELEGYRPGQWTGPVVVTFILDPCAMTPGTYVLDAAVHSRGGEPYDFWHRCVTFRVRDEIQDIGGVRPDHAWRFDKSIFIDPDDKDG